MSAPIINVPSVVILSTDTVTKRPTVVSGSGSEEVIAIDAHRLAGAYLDPRAFDGSTPVVFLRRVRENLET